MLLSAPGNATSVFDFVLQTYLNKNYSPVRVDAMLFAPPNVGDKTFAEAYGAVVNGRRCVKPSHQC